MIDDDEELVIDICEYSDIELIKFLKNKGGVISIRMGNRIVLELLERILYKISKKDK